MTELEKTNMRLDLFRTMVEQFIELSAEYMPPDGQDRSRDLCDSFFGADVAILSAPTSEESDGEPDQ